VHSEDPGRLARMAYSYLHVLIVAGVIVGAVGDELVLTHPDHADDAGIAAIIGGPMLFLLGNALFKWTTHGRPRPPLSHVVGLLLLLVLLPLALVHLFSALALGAITTAIVVLVAVWESVTLRTPVVVASTVESHE
jgi:low temperature requirement protein LtrA